MDTRIEELSKIIIERCENSLSESNKTDKSDLYFRISVLSNKILDILEEYRKIHKDEY